MPKRYTLKLKTQLAETKRTLPTESKHKKTLSLTVIRQNGLEKKVGNPERLKFHEDK